MRISPDKKGADKLFEIWFSNLHEKTKDKDSLYSNFSDLFFELNRHFITYEVAYELLKPAVTKHLPDKFIVSRTYKNSTASKGLSENEFFESWKQLILDRALQAFYDVYPLQEAKRESEKIQLPKGMSKREYSLQRKHAQEYPLIDLKLLDEMYKKILDEDSVNVFEDILGDF